MTMFKRIQPDAVDERDRSGTTALVWFYFWFAGLFSLFIAGMGIYNLINHHPGTSVLLVGIWLVVALLYIIGAWQIGRYNRNGIILIAIGLAIGAVGWIFDPPKTNDIVFALFTAIALVYAWQDLTQNKIPS